jgi:hypothetical protein
MAGPMMLCLRYRWRRCRNQCQGGKKPFHGPPSIHRSYLSDLRQDRGPYNKLGLIVIFTRFGNLELCFFFSGMTMGRDKHISHRPVFPWSNSHINIPLLADPRTDIRASAIKMTNF